MKPAAGADRPREARIKRQADKAIRAVVEISRCAGDNASVSDAADQARRHLMVLRGRAIDAVREADGG